MPDTIEQVILDVQSVCPDADPNLARLWVRDAGRRTMEARQWSWLHKRGQFVIPDAVTETTTSQTCTVTQGSDEVEFSGSVATTAMVGRQIRFSSDGPIFDIIAYLGPTTVRIYPSWQEDTAAGSDFTIFLCRLPLPSDCLELLSVVSPAHRWQLWLHVPQETIDGLDPSRTRSGSEPSILSPLDYSTIFAGSVKPAVLVSGSGSKPTTSGTYTGQDDAVYTVQVTTGGVGGTAVFKWKKDEGSFTTGVVSDSVSGNELSDGVVVFWAGATTFTLNDIFVIRTTAGTSPGTARMELYPHSYSQMTLQYLYAARYPDLTDDNVQIPGALASRTDILREKALEFAAAWPGTEDRPNPYNQINRRDYHAQNWMLLTLELSKQDNALFQRNVRPPAVVPFAPWPFSRGNPQEFDYFLDYPDTGYRRY